jgi:hypothetical protein
VVLAGLLGLGWARIEGLLDFALLAPVLTPKVPGLSFLGMALVSPVGRTELDRKNK